MTHVTEFFTARAVRHLLALMLMATAFAFGMVGAVQAAPVNINKAGAEEIAAALNGIGIKKAREIIAFREKHGPFKSVDQLVDVKGIGEKMLKKNRADLRLQ